MAPHHISIVPAAELDEDIQSMKGNELVKNQRTLKSQGVETRTSGAVADLRQYLHQARRNSSAQSQDPTTPGAAEDGESSVATPTASLRQSTASAPLPRIRNAEDVFITYRAVHPVTKACLEKLGGQKQEITTLEESSQEGSAPSRLDALLQPAVMLVDAVINAK